MEVGDKVVTGTFQNDAYVEAGIVNVNKLAEKSASVKLSDSVSSYLKEIKHQMQAPLLKNFSDLYLLLKESLVGHAYQLLQREVIRMDIYLKIRNAFAQSKKFGNVLEQALNILRFGTFN